MLQEDIIKGIVAGLPDDLFGAMIGTAVGMVIWFDGKVRDRSGSSSQDKTEERKPVRIRHYTNTLGLKGDVRVTPSSFNPSVNQKTGIFYHLRQDARVTVHIFGPEGELIQTLIENTGRTSGNHKEIWDGKDKNDQIVPDEAYSFVIKAVDNNGHEESHTPFASEWTRFDASESKISKITNTITYIDFQNRVAHE